MVAYMGGLIFGGGALIYLEVYSITELIERPVHMGNAPFHVISFIISNITMLEIMNEIT